MDNEIQPTPPEPRQSEQLDEPRRQPTDDRDTIVRALNVALERDLRDLFKREMAA